MPSVPRPLQGRSFDMKDRQMGNSPFGSSGDAGKHAPISTFYRDTAWIGGRAEDQLAQVARWPGMAAIAAFPDLHPGRHGPVGAAFLADRIYPQLIGPDIGCGMALFRLSLPRRRFKADKAARRIREIEAPYDAERAETALAEAGIAMSAGLTPYGLGTIGGGNHFVEVQAVREPHLTEEARSLGLSAGDLCLMVHSGSRGQGAAIFTELEARWAEGYQAQSDEGQRYTTRHDAARDWARLNRRIIAERAAEALRCDITALCDSSHNHLSHTPEGWLHRKGAAEADGGLAPLAGSRDSLSYLLSVQNGPPEALASLSHGAGRRYDRASMHGRIPRVKSALQSMARNSFGGTVICEDRDLLIEEAGQAYKNSKEVQADLEGFGIASVIASLEPLLTFKTARGGGVA